MSWMPCADPDMDSHECPSNVEMVIIPRTHDIGGFEVQRALPFAKRRMVGPFIFWDQMGPGEFVTGNGIDVRPHPHIGLSTVTYLFKGTMDHKDSLGTDMRIAKWGHNHENQKPRKLRFVKGKKYVTRADRARAAAKKAIQRIQVAIQHSAHSRFLLLVQR